MRGDPARPGDPLATEGLEDPKERPDEPKESPEDRPGEEDRLEDPREALRRSPSSSEVEFVGEPPQEREADPKLRPPPKPPKPPKPPEEEDRLEEGEEGEEIDVLRPRP